MSASGGGDLSGFRDPGERPRVSGPWKQEQRRTATRQRAVWADRGSWISTPWRPAFTARW